MDERVTRLKSPKECEAFIANAHAAGREDLVREARHRIVDLRMQAYEAKSEVEAACVRAIYAYEEVLSVKNGRRVTAVQAWQVARKLGVLAAVDKMARRPDENAAHPALKELGLEIFAVEHVIVRHPDEFSFEAVENSRRRVAAWTKKD